MRPAILAAIMAVCLSISPVVAQTVPVQGAPSSSSPAQIAPAQDASLTRSAMRATTFKVGTTITNFGILTYAAGGLVGGVALTAFVTASSWLLYTANDYVWDRYSPPPAKQTADQAFDANADVWRTTKKFLTYKPIIGTLKILSIYAYTGSRSVALIYGTATIMTNTVVFYANNLAWDYYDWHASRPLIVAGTKP